MEGHRTMLHLTTLCRVIALSGCIVLLSCLASVFAERGELAPFTVRSLSVQLASAHSLLESSESFLQDPPPRVEDQTRTNSEFEGDPWEDAHIDVARKHYGRAALETTAVLGGAALYYWGTLTFASDFDHDVSLETLRKKFTGEAIRFDDNPINTNSFPGHPMAGAYYYLIARNQHLSRLESFLMGAAASSLHEFFIELPEVASIVDLVTTPVAGAAIGEAMHAFGRYFRCAQRQQTLLYKIMAFMMDPVYVVDRWIWREKQHQATRDVMCRDMPLNNAFSLLTGLSAAYPDHTDRAPVGFLGGFHGKLYQLPQDGREAAFSGLVSDTVLTEISLEVIATEHGLDSLRFLAKTIWGAYYRRHLVGDPAGQRTGWSVLVGLASGFEHTQYDTGEFDDWIGALHALGPSIELTIMQQDNYLRFGVEVFGDFAMVRAFALDKYKQQHTVAGIKTVLREENYYYAVGVHIHATLEGQYGPYRLATEYKYAHYDSIEGADRHKISRDFHLEDTQAEYRVTVGRRLDFLPVKFLQSYPTWIEAEWRRIDRTGWIADDHVAHAGDTMWLLLGLRMYL
jgi:hypothetical protein